MGSTRKKRRGRRCRSCCSMERKRTRIGRIRIALMGRGIWLSSGESIQAPVEMAAREIAGELTLSALIDASFPLPLCPSLSPSVDFQGQNVQIPTFSTWSRSPSLLSLLQSPHLHGRARPPRSPRFERSQDPVLLPRDRMDVRRDEGGGSSSGGEGAAG